MARPGTEAGRSGSPSSARDRPASTRRSTSSGSRASPSRWISTTACRRPTAWSASASRRTTRRSRTSRPPSTRRPLTRGSGSSATSSSGKDVTIEDLRAHYHQIVYTTGAQTDRRMGIPGEDLRGSHPATDFVAWYNGHPDYREHRFDLSQERVAVVGVGNVAVDVVRILCRTPEELAATDISDDALAALRESRVREVYLLGRRGPAQAAFTNPEIRELGELPGADVRREARRGRAGPALARRAREERRPGHAQEGRDPARVRAADAAREAPDPDRPLPRVAGGAPRRRERGGHRPARRPQRASRDGGRHAPGPPHRPVRRAVRGARVPLGRIPGSADPRRALPRRLGRDPERQGARARAGQPRAAARGVRRRMDQARPYRRHRHQQARRRGDGRVHGGGRGPGPRARALRAGAPAPPSPWCASASPSTSRGPTGSGSTRWRSPAGAPPGARA